MNITNNAMHINSTTYVKWNISQKEAAQNHLFLLSIIIK